MHTRQSLKLSSKCEDSIHLSTTLHKKISFTHHSFHGNMRAQETDPLTSEWLYSSVGKSTAPALQKSWVRIPLRKTHIRQSLRFSSKCEDHFYNLVIKMKIKIHGQKGLTSHSQHPEKGKPNAICLLLFHQSREIALGLNLINLDRKYS